MKQNRRDLPEALTRQLKLNRSKNLLHSRAELLLEVEPTFVAAIERLIGSPPEAAGGFNAEDLAADAADWLIERIQSVNQYIQVDGQARDILVGIYLDSWKRLAKTRNIEQTLRTCHYPKLRKFLEGLYPEELREALRSAEDLGQVPSSEYSADLQMRLLMLDPSRTREPILDLGCGRSAHLVRRLRAENLDAHGIDRNVGSSADFLADADWFDFDIGHSRWGTIIAHMSFTNHIVYCQRHDAGSLVRYVRRYAEILDALRPGGSFLYTPGVQTVEDEVDSQRFELCAWAVSGRITATRITKLAQERGPRVDCFELAPRPGG